MARAIPWKDLPALRECARLLVSLCACVACCVLRVKCCVCPSRFYRFAVRRLRFAQMCALLRKGVHHSQLLESLDLCSPARDLYSGVPAVPKGCDAGAAVPSVLFYRAACGVSRDSRVA